MEDRGSSGCIDRLFMNLKVDKCGTLPPLEPDLPDQGAPSDHKIAFVTSKIPRVKDFKWLSYSYRYFNPESVERFASWITFENWERVTAQTTSNGKAEACLPGGSGRGYWALFSSHYDET